MRRSRRRFLRLLVTGSALAAAAPAALARPVAPKRPAKAPSAPRPATGPSPAVTEELGRQAAALAETLRKVRDFPLPPGSEPAGRFAPLGSRRRAGRP